jgi:hypothetical protein
MRLSRNRLSNESWIKELRWALRYGTQDGHVSFCSKHFGDAVSKSVV